MKIDVVIIEPQTPGNIGAVARVMKNFGFENLVLINPKCKIDQDARNRAVHAQDVLKKAKRKKEKFLEKYDYKIGTTAISGGDYNIPRSPLTPSELGFMLKEKKGKKLALIFGREDHGLSNEEIRKCDFIVTIPTSSKYKTMNLSHSVSVILYELHKVFGVRRISERIKPIGRKEKDTLLKLINKTVDEMNFRTEAKKETQKKVWKRLIGKGMLTNREAMSLMGFFRKFKK